MKKLLYLLFLLPSLSLADRLGSLNANSNVLLSTQAGSGGGVTVYSATATASFPFGFSASTVTLSSATVTGHLISNSSVFLGGSTGSSLFGYPLQIRGAPFSTASFGYDDSGVVFTSGSLGFYTSGVEVLGSANGTSLQTNVPLTFSGYDCSGNLNSGKLTANASGIISCADDISGGGVSVYPATSTVYLNQGTRENVDTFNANVTLTSTHTVVLASSTASSSITVTLPAATNRGQILEIYKVDGATHSVVVMAAGTDLIGGTTTQFRINTQGAVATLKADGSTGWWGKIPPDLMYSGPEQKWGITTAAAVLSSQAVVTAFLLNDYFTAKGVFIQIGTSSGFIDVGIYDGRSRAKLASSGRVPSPGTGQQLINFASPIHLEPGSYYIATGVADAAFTATRCSNQSTFGAMVVAAAHPLIAALADPPGSQTATVWCMTLAGVDGMSR